MRISDWKFRRVLFRSVCPTSLSYVAEVFGKLGSQADAIRPVFLTVDPERDTAEVLSEYTDLFDPRILGVTGAPDQVAAALKSLAAYARKVPQDGGYTMDHTATMLLLDARSEEHTSELQSLMRSSYAVFCLK